MNSSTPRFKTRFTAAARPSRSMILVSEKTVETPMMKTNMGIETFQAHARRNFVEVTGAADHQELDGARHILPSAPGADFGERVGAHDEEQLAIRVHSRPHFLDGVDGVTAPRVLLQTRHLEAPLVRARQLRHAHA